MVEHGARLHEIEVSRECRGAVPASAMVGTRSDYPFGVKKARNSAGVRTRFVLAMPVA